MGRRQHTLQGIGFEWDSEKGIANQSKHGIAFETACEVFFDPFVRVEDATGEQAESRNAAIGLTVSWQLLNVVFVERGEILRLVSARAATAQERKRYEEQ